MDEFNATGNAAGQILSRRYKVRNILGSGGMSQAFLAEDTQRPSNPQCVVKKLQPLSQDPKLLAIARTLFHREAEVLEHLGEHDQIPRLLAHFEEDQEFYLVEEFIDGQPLSAELLPGQPWTEAKVVQFLLEILPILEYIHGQNVIHRDIKPDNIIRRRQDGKFVLIDFGAVRQVQADLTASNPALAATIVGTLGYMPTEQACGHPKLNSDLYALGIICLQALTGLMLTQLPINNETGEFQWPEYIPVSPGLTAVITKMVRNHTKDRYPNATEALNAVKNLQSNSSTPYSANPYMETQVSSPQFRAPQPQSSPQVQPLSQPLSQPQKSRKPLALIGVGLAAAAGVALLGNQVLSLITSRPQGTFGGDRVLDIGILSSARPERKAADEALVNYLKAQIQEQFGDQATAKFYPVNISEDNAAEQAKQAIKTKKWDLAFTMTPMLSATAVANQYKFVARMSPNRAQSESVLFVRKDSPIQSIDDLKSDKTIALADFNSAQGFYMPVYDLFGKTLRVDMNNSPSESMEKVRSGAVDVGASVFTRTLREAKDLRVLHQSRAIPLAGVYVSPTLTSQDQKYIADTLLKAPADLQEKARYGAGQAIDYTEFLKVVSRVESITSCSNWQVNPVRFFCDTPVVAASVAAGEGIVGTTNGYRAYQDRLEFILQGVDGKTYRLVLPRTVLDTDPNLDTPTALNFRKVSVQSVQPTKVKGMSELRITAPGQLLAL